MSDNLLSTGDPATLGNYHKLCKTVGFDKAAKYFADKIQEEGEDSVVLQCESQVMVLIMSIES